MTKTYASIKGGVKLAARYLADKEIYEKNLYKEIKRYDNSIISNLQKQREHFKKVKIEIDAITKRWNILGDKLSKLYDSDNASFHDKVEGKDVTNDEAITLSLAKILADDDGVFLSYGQHAAGVIISQAPIENAIPEMWNNKNKKMETQCQMAQAESRGFLKMDFLVLENLAIITDVIRKVHNDPNYIDLQDPNMDEKLFSLDGVYREIFCKGLTKGVFQFESDGIIKYIVGLQPNCFEDLVLLNAGYRPGPMQFLDEIVERKKYERGEIATPPKRSININNAILNEILEPTYGCIIYQEQVMQIFQRLAGYSLGGADLVRRAMSKKHKDEIEAERNPFIYGDASRNIVGCLANGISEEDGNALYDCMIAFAEYAFNKSHAVAYTKVAFMTAYLKWAYPLEFFTASLNHIAKIDEVKKFIAELPFFNIKILPPTLLYSANEFTNNNTDTIYFGTRYVKSLSEMDFVKENDIVSFIKNNNISLKVMVLLVKIGFLDCISSVKNREMLFEKVKQVYESFDTIQKDEDNLATLEETLDVLTMYRDKSKFSIEEKIDLLKYVGGKKAELITPKKVTTAYDKANAKIIGLQEEIDDLKEQLRMLFISCEDDKPNVLQNRQWELEYLGYPFSIEDSLSKIYYTKSFDDFSDDINKLNTNEIGIIILDVNSLGKTKKGLYRIIVCDKNRKQKTLYFTEKPNVSEGIITLNKTFTYGDKEGLYNPYAGYKLEEIVPVKKAYFYFKEYECLKYALNNIDKQLIPDATMSLYRYYDLKIPCNYDNLLSVLKNSPYKNDKDYYTDREKMTIKRSELGEKEDISIDGNIS